MSTTRSKVGIDVSGVSHSFDALAVLHDVDLRVDCGEVCCLLGPSGCGKSTLLRLIAGLEVLQHGRIAIAGHEVARPGAQQPAERRSIGFVFQDYALFPHLDVRANIAFGVPKSEAGRVEDLLRQVDMTAFADAMPHTLSGGQQQRVALARALARTPDVMLLDEPFSGLDARLRDEVRGATLDLLRQAGVATLMVTHDPQEALVAGDRVVVMTAGQVLQTGSPAEVYRLSADLRIAETFGPVNRWHGVVANGRVTTPLGTFVSPPELTEGTLATVALRPEAIRIASPEHRDDGAVEATVDAVTHEGTTVCLRVHLADGSTLDVRDLARSTLTAGQTVHLEVAEGDAMVFRRTT